MTPWTLSGVTTAGSTVVSPGGSVTFTDKLTANGATAPGICYSARYFYANTIPPPLDGSNTYNGAAIGGAETVGATNLCNQTVTLGTPITFTDTVNVAAGQTAKYLCATLAFSPPSSTTTGNGRSTASCVAVAFQPFLSILGGDVVAGANPCGTGGSTTANITSWNSDSGSFYGAGSQLGALATGTMTSFASGLGTGSVTGSSLSFANTSVSPPNYGGSFGTMPCIRITPAAR